MKKLINLLFLFSVSCWIIAQAPQKMSYQCVIRNATGNLIVNQSIGVKISILQGSASGIVVYQEIFNPNPQTNANGLLSLEIGTGPAITGTFSGINWESGPFFLKTETDPSGGTSYTISGTSQLLSVPYSLYSRTSELIKDNSVTSSKIVDGSILATDLAASSVTTDKISTGAVTGSKIAQVGASTGQALKWDGTSWTPGNDLQGSSLWTESGSDIYYNDGAVGIGTSTPEGFCNILGNSNIFFPHLLLTENEGDYSRLMFKNTAVPTKSWAIAGRSNSPDRDSRLNFWYSNGSTGENIMSITGDGTVGIGTTDPGTLLQVHSNTTYAYGITPIIRISDNFKEWNIGLGDTDDRFSIASDDYAERFTIMKSSGYVGIGTIAPAAGLHIKASTWPGSFIYLESNNGGDAGFRLYEGSAVRWHIYNNSTAGGLQIENNALATAVFVQQSSANVGIGTSTPVYKLQVGNAGDGTQARANAWNILSDARLKKNFTKLINPLGMVEKLNGYYFYWNSGIDKSRQVGFSAQQVSEVIPEVVSQGEDGYLSLEYSKMVPLLVEAIKELETRNDELNARLANIEKQLGLRPQR